jgi:hypothetical protein
VSSNSKNTLRSLPRATSDPSDDDATSERDAAEDEASAVAAAAGGEDGTAVPSVVGAVATGVLEQAINHSGSTRVIGRTRGCMRSPSLRGGTTADDRASGPLWFTPARIDRAVVVTLYAAPPGDRGGRWRKKLVRM